MTTARILVVEDESITAELLRELLQNMGHSVCALAAYGEDAVEKALSMRPDLVLMDIKLRGTMNGIEAAEKIQSVYDVPVIYLTAYTDNVTLEMAKTTQPFGYIQKPFRWGEINSGIEIALYRHRMDRELREREHSYRVLADNLPGILYQFSLTGGGLKLFNDMLFAITGHGAAELPPGDHGPLESLIVNDDMKSARDTIANAVAKKISFELEYRIRHKNGETRHVIEYGRPITDGEGVPFQIDGMIFDVTERKRIEDELLRTSRSLEERKTFFEAIISNNDSGILVTDHNMRILLANPHVRCLCEKEPDETLGKHLADVCPEIHMQIAAGIDSGEITLNSSGREMVIGFSRFNLKGVDRAVVGHIINFKDLSEIVSIRKEMQHKERLSTMGEVVARVAHEMRNPLFGMTAVGQILDMELELNPSHKLLIDSFLKEARRLNNLVEELLDCTREIRLRKKKVNLLRIIDASISVNEALAKERGIAIARSLPTGELFLSADPEKLEQVILNLLKNAIEASTSGETIDLTLEKDEDSVCLKVVDRGNGIPVDVMDKIFDVFYTTKKNGTGMGLSISKNIVDAHGGNLSASNNPDRGATFSLFLPLNGIFP